MHSAECRARLETFVGTGQFFWQCASWCAGRGDAAPDVPMDGSSPASVARQDEVSAMEGTCSDAFGTEPVQGVMVAAAQHENKRQRTMSRLLTIHELEQMAALCGASLGYLCGSTTESS